MLSSESFDHNSTTEPGPVLCPVLKPAGPRRRSATRATLATFRPLENASLAPALKTNIVTQYSEPAAVLGMKDSHNQSESDPMTSSNKLNVVTPLGLSSPSNANQFKNSLPNVKNVIKEMSELFSRRESMNGVQPDARQQTVSSPRSVIRSFIMSSPDTSTASDSAADIDDSSSSIDIDSSMDSQTTDEENTNTDTAQDSFTMQSPISRSENVDHADRMFASVSTEAMSWTPVQPKGTSLFDDVLLPGVDVLYTPQNTASEMRQRAVAPTPTPATAAVAPTNKATVSVSPEPQMAVTRTSSRASIADEQIAVSSVSFNQAAKTRALVIKAVGIVMLIVLFVEYLIRSLRADMIENALRSGDYPRFL
jgi:hypothetical protein